MVDGILQVFSMEVLSPKHRGVANSGYQGASQVAVAISAPIGGLLIRDLGYTPVFLITAVCYFLAQALFWWRFGGKRFVTPKNTQAEPMEVTSQDLGELENITVSPEYAEQG
jgi:predicted MFS family arabinose efflux permease